MSIINCGWDTETYLIGAPDNLIPKIVCGSWDTGDWSHVASTGDGNDLWDTTLRMFESAYNQDTRIIIHNAAFDVCVALRFCWDVIAGERPGDPKQARDLQYLIWETLEKSMDNEWSRTGPVLVSDTIIREKLLNLSTHGSLTFDAKGRDLRYSLADLVYRRLKIDIRGKKVEMGGDGRYYDKDGNDVTGTPLAGEAWRLRYCELDGIPCTQWPSAAYEYALMDAAYARQVWEHQERHIDRRRGAAHYTCNSESLQVYTDIALNCATANGFWVDQEQVRRVSSEINNALAKMEPILVDHGILRRNGSCHTKIVKERVEGMWNELDRAPLLTDSGEIATNKEVMEILAHMDPVLDIYAERQLLAKLRDAFLPNLQGSQVWTTFDVLKETGRTSSRGGDKKGKRKPLFPAVNSQQMPRRPGIRECFLPPAPGYLICSDDYQALELCSVGQVTYSLFGQSVHRDKINAGYDLHSYLGGAIAALMEPDLVGGIALSMENMDLIYRNFCNQRDYKGDDEMRLYGKKRAKHFRNMAKPVGLGYPGGLAQKTMVVFAQTVYKVDMSESEAEELKELWLHIYPEMQRYFDWVRDSVDRVNRRTDEDGHPQTTYGYITDGFNRFRAGATYCATSNGKAMQSLSADGAKRGVCWLNRACAGALEEDNPYRILDECYYLTFIHDEHLIAVPDDDLATERSLAISKLMCEAMQMHMPDIHINAEPALMRRWRKEAEAEWRQQDGAWERAMDLCQKKYGTQITNQVAGMFRAPGGTAPRLEPYEDFNECEVAA